MNTTADLLIHYLREAFEAAGLSWEPDNSAEIGIFVDRLTKDAAAAAIKELADRYRNASHSIPGGAP
jgi:hypothetical protein